MAMLEAFVHDPLINWRLLNTTDAGVADSNFIQDGSGRSGALLGFPKWGQVKPWGLLGSPYSTRARPSALRMLNLTCWVSVLEV